MAPQGWTIIITPCTTWQPYSYKKNGFQNVPLTKWPSQPDNRQNPELYYTTTLGISSTQGAKDHPSNWLESRWRLNFWIWMFVSMGCPCNNRFHLDLPSKLHGACFRCQDGCLRHSIWCKHDDPTAATVSWRYWLVRERKPRVFQCFQGTWALFRIYLEKVWNKLDETLIGHGQAVPQWCLLRNQVF